MLRRNCNVNLDNLGLDRRDLDGEPQQARGIPRNLQLDETVAVRYGVIWQIPELVGESSLLAVGCSLAPRTESYDT